MENTWSSCQFYAVYLGFHFSLSTRPHSSLSFSFPTGVILWRNHITSHVGAFNFVAYKAKANTPASNQTADCGLFKGRHQVFVSSVSVVPSLESGTFKVFSRYPLMEWAVGFRILRTSVILDAIHNIKTKLRTCSFISETGQGQRITTVLLLTLH